MATIAFDNKVFISTDATDSATLTTGAFTIGSGTNRFAVAFLCFGAGAIPAGISGSISGSGGNFVAITGASVSNGTSVSSVGYGLVAPGSGSKTVTFSWTGNRSAHLLVLTGTGADQTGGITTFPHGTSNTGTGTGFTTPTNVTVTSATNNGVIGACSSVNFQATSISDTTWFNSGLGTTNNSFGNYLFPTNAASHQLTGTLSANDTWAYAATDILAASAATPSIPIWPIGM